VRGTRPTWAGLPVRLEREGLPAYRVIVDDAVIGRVWQLESGLWGWDLDGDPDSPPDPAIRVRVGSSRKSALEWLLRRHGELVDAWATPPTDVSRATSERPS